jgi:RNA polymerase sigma factor (sigma-70 family)
VRLVTPEQAAQVWNERGGDHGEYVRHLLLKWTTAPPTTLTPLRRHEVDDLYQEIFLKLLDQNVRFDGRSEAATWLYRVARNTVADYQRRERRMRERHRAWADDAACQQPPLGHGSRRRSSPEKSYARDAALIDGQEPSAREEHDTDAHDAEQLIGYEEPEQEKRLVRQQDEADARTIVAALLPRLRRIGTHMVDGGLTQEQAAAKEGVTARTFRTLAERQADKLGIVVQRRRHRG